MHDWLAATPVQSDLGLRASEFGFPSDLGFRVSGFGFARLASYDVAAAISGGGSVSPLPLCRISWASHRYTTSSATFLAWSPMRSRLLEMTIRFKQREIVSGARAISSASSPCIFLFNKSI